MLPFQKYLQYLNRLLIRKMPVEAKLSLGNLLRCLHYYILSIPYVRLIDNTPFKHL